MEGGEKDACAFVVPEREKEKKKGEGHH